MIFLQLSRWLGRVIANFDYSEVFGFHCVPVVVLKNCETELSYVSAEFFNLCLNESSSPDFWKVLTVAAIFKNIWNTSATKNYYPVSLLFVVNKFFEKLVNYKVVDHLVKFGFFLISSMTSDLLIQPKFLQGFSTGFEILALSEIWYSSN